MAGAAFLLSLCGGAEAQTLPRDVLPDHYDLRLALNLNDNTFTGEENLLVDVRKSTNEITLNAAGIVFDDVRIVAGWSSQPADVTLDEARQIATLTVRRKLPVGSARIELTYSGRMTTDLRGLYFGTANNRKWAATQFEATYARRLFPCFDEPDMKASFSITAVVPSGDVAISNGRVLSDTPGPGTNEHTVKFATTKKISTYVVALAVGDFECIGSPDALAPVSPKPGEGGPKPGEGGPKGAVPVRVCAIRGQAGNQRFALDAATAFLGFYGNYFTTKYPFAKLDLVAIPQFDGGGMENVGAIFFGEDNLLVAPNGAPDDQRKVAETVSHEIAHQWLGDLVTMKWWNDLWLKEGLATWIETKPLVAWKPAWHAGMDEVTSAEDAMAIDELESTHPVRLRLNTPGEIEEAYDAITYQKAAAVVRMVEAVMGPDSFRAAINDYLRKFAYANADTSDFQATLAEHSTLRPVDGILRTFLEQPGVPIVALSAACDSPSTSKLTVTQSRFWIDARHAKSESSPAWVIPLFTRTAAQSSQLTNLVTEHQQQFPIGSCNQPIVGNVGAAGYYRTRYAAETVAQMAKEVVPRLAQAEKLRLLNDQWALARANVAGISEYMVVLEHVFDGEAHGEGLRSVEDRDVLIDRIAATLLVIDRDVVSANDRDAFRAWVLRLLQPLAADPRLVFIRGSVGRDADLLSRAKGKITGASLEPVPLVGAEGGAPPAAPAWLRDVYGKLAAMNGDEQVFDRLVADDQLDALGYFSDPALIDRALTFALSDRVAATDALAIVVSSLQNSPAPWTAWTFVKSHWDEFVKKVGTANQGAAAIMDAVTSTCDPLMRDSVKVFFESKGYSGSRALRQAIERIQSCIDFRNNQSQNFKLWIESISARKPQD